MELLQERITSDRDSSLSILFVDEVFECFLCEDEFRAEKVKAETRIPAGAYEVRLRAEGGMHAKYAEKFGAWHAGMLWIRDVPGFEYVYLHIGNDEGQSEGCPLTGRSAVLNGAGGGTVGYSGGAYQRLYPKVRDALQRGERVRITIVDRDRR